MHHFFQLLFGAFCLLFLQSSYSQKKYSFTIQTQYSTYESELSEKPGIRIVYLSNNQNNDYLRFTVKNDTVQNIVINDKVASRVFFSRQKFALDSNLQKALSLLKFEMIEQKFPDTTNDNIEIKSSYSNEKNTINIREFNNLRRKEKGIKNDLYIVTSKKPQFINTQNFSIGMITHHRIQDAKPVNNEVILESYYLVNNFKADIYKLDKIEAINFEIKIL